MLQKEMVLKKKIAAIDISDSTNFVLKIPSENKTVDFGDGSNINVKILWIIDLMNNKEKRRSWYNSS